MDSGMSSTRTMTTRSFVLSCEIEYSADPTSDPFAAEMELPGKEGKGVGFGPSLMPYHA